MNFQHLARLKSGPLVAAAGVIAGVADARLVREAPLAPQ